MLVDAHTHIFPPDVAARRAAYLESEPWFGQLYRSARARVATAEDLLASMQRAGIDISIVASFGWRDEAIGHRCSDYMVDVAVASKGRICPLAYVQPSLGSEAERQLDRDLARGFKGIGELMPDGQGFRLDDHELLAPHLHLAADADVPVLVHVTEPVGHLYPGKGTADVAAFWRLAKAFPRTKFVAAHWGGGLPFYELMPELKMDLQNVWYDTAATSLLYDSRIFRTVLDIVCPEKVLFASDYPVLRQQELLEEVRELRLPECHRSKVLGDNARVCFHLVDPGSSRVFGQDSQAQ